MIERRDQERTARVRGGTRSGDWLAIMTLSRAIRNAALRCGMAEFLTGVQGRRRQGRRGKRDIDDREPAARGRETALAMPGEPDKLGGGGAPGPGGGLPGALDYTAPAENPLQDLSVTPDDAFPIS